MLSRIAAVLCITATVAGAALIPGSQRQIITGAANNGFPDFAAAPFRANTVAGTLKAANLFGSTVTLNGGLSVEACSTVGIAWLSPLGSPSTANSGTGVNFTTTSDFAARNAIGNTGF